MRELAIILACMSLSIIIGTKITSDRYNDILNIQDIEELLLIVENCEKALPRTEVCEVVITAQPK